MPRLHYVKLSKDWKTATPIPASTIISRLGSQRIMDIGYSGKLGELDLSIKLADGSYIIVQPKPDGASIGLIEVKF
jgi:hypothetical protein